MDNKLATKGWQTIAIWLGLVAAALYTSNALIQVFFQIVQAMFSNLGGDITALFQNVGLLFTTIIAIALILFLVLAWLNLVSFTFDVIDIVFQAEEEVEDSVYPASVIRWLTFSWGLFFVLFLILPIVVAS